jgi:hypothetical protein
MQSGVALQSAIQRFQLGEKRFQIHGSFEYSEDNPYHEKYPFNPGSIHGKRDYVS